MRLERTKLKNTYWGMRHGFSVPQKLEIINSDPKMGRMIANGLTIYGREEVCESAENNSELDWSTIIVCSDFSRTRQTAEIVASVLCSGWINATPHLRERYFGKYEGLSNVNYQIVWNGDKRNPDNHRHEGESVNDVVTRELLTIRIAESAYSGRKILLVSHGDSLQILECWFRGINPRLHRSLPALKNAEIRRLTV